MNESTGPEDLGARLDRLERRQRRLVVGNATLGIAIAAVLLLGMGSDQVLRASAIHLMDDKGNLRILMNARAGISLLDEEKRPRAVLSVDREGPGLALYGTTSRVGTILNINRAGPALTMRDNAGHNRVLLAALDQGPALILSDESERERAAIIVRGGLPALTLLGDSGKPLWSAP